MTENPDPLDPRVELDALNALASSEGYQIFAAHAKKEREDYITLNLDETQMPQLFRNQGAANAIGELGKWLPSRIATLEAVIAKARGAK